MIFIFSNSCQEVKYLALKVLGNWIPKNHICQGSDKHCASSQFLMSVSRQWKDWAGTSLRTIEFMTSCYQKSLMWLIHKGIQTLSILSRGKSSWIFSGPMRYCSVTCQCVRVIWYFISSTRIGVEAIRMLPGWCKPTACRESQYKRYTNIQIQLCL